MNCRPGDLAIVVQVRIPEGLHNLGKVVRCLSTTKGPISGLPCWRTDPPLTTTGTRQAVVRDAHLRPIRDPGDDARDETLEWLPVPSRETEAA